MLIEYASRDQLEDFDIAYSTSGDEADIAKLIIIIVVAKQTIPTLFGRTSKVLL